MPKVRISNQSLSQLIRASVNLCCKSNTELSFGLDDEEPIEEEDNWLHE
jgi:hypothetical protein